MNEDELKYFDDDALLGVAARTFNTSVYYLVQQAQTQNAGQHFTNHVDNVFSGYMQIGRVPKYVRSYVEDILTGKKPFIGENDKAALLA